MSMDCLQDVQGSDFHRIAGQLQIKHVVINTCQAMVLSQSNDVSTMSNMSVVQGSDFHRDAGELHDEHAATSSYGFQLFSAPAKL